MKHLLLLALMLLPQLSYADAPPPNVVMILSDDQAWTDYGFMGHEAIQTPHLDKLAAEGALYTRGYVPGSLCRCSLATLVTGLYPHQHGITSNDPPPGVDRHDMLRYIEAATTLPALLGKHGYLSMQSGKWWEGNYRLGGFTHGMTCGDPAHGGRHGDEGLTIGREGMAPVFDFIDQAEGKPFFLWYAPFLPHEPHTPPEHLLAKYRTEGRSDYVAKYWAMCEFFDETIGGLMQRLEEKGLRENTMVVYVADNGWIQNKDKSGYAPRSKRSPYDGGLRTPIIVNWPGHVAPLRNETTPVLSLDLVPTILAACGIEPTPAMPGVNLLDANALAARPRIFGEVFTHNAVDIARPERSLLYRWAIEGDWKLILPQSSEEAPSLYNITQDPHENENLATKEPNRAATLAGQIDTWWNPEAL
jgi:arylsulfatase A-like enzyme